MTMIKDNYRLALLKVHGTAVLFGASGVFGALAETGADMIVLGRVLIAFVALSLFFLFRRQTLIPMQRRELASQGLSGVLLGVHWVSFYQGIKVGGVAIGTLGFASFPAFVALFEMLLFKERLKAKEYFLLIAISIGLILITPAFEFGHQATQGLLWGIFSALSYGILAVINRKNVSNISGAQSSWCQYLVVALMLLPVSGQQLPEVSWQDWFWIACIGLLCTTLAYTLFVSSLASINARTAAMIISLEPVYAIAIAWIWLDEVPSWRMLLGGALIIVSVAMVNLKK
ncbi:DMT family transporter [Bisgaard Taxon 45]|uniref:DMT family transporter n=1 Tax=Bisgaard Taxon 45 TaxID=304289 RepID=A0ABT9KBA1_9PAST|nr:DMT family transporter [Bisgaard Taxon 45]